MLRRVGGEPSIAVSPDGRTVLVTGAGPAESGMYRSIDGGATYQLIRPRFARSGNADLDISFLDNTTVVAADLSISGDGILVHRSTDRGSTWTTTSINYDLYDRPWIDHVGSTVYVVSRGFDQVPYLFTSADGGRTFGLPTPVVGADEGGLTALAGRTTILQHLAVDESSGDVYVLKQHGTDLYVSRLGEGATTFETYLAVRNGSAWNGFNWMTVDAAGTVYVLAHTAREGGPEGSWLFYSTDRGKTWSEGVDLGPDDGSTTVFGAVDGGANGTLSFVYLRGPEGLPSDQAQDWYAEVGVVRRANTSRPVVDRTRPVAKPVHTADICSMGVLCTRTQNRNLLDYVSTEITRNGTVFAVVGSDGPATGDTPAVGVRGVTGVVFRTRR